MSEQDVVDAGPTLERIGAAGARIGAHAGMELMSTIMIGVRHRRARLKRNVYPVRDAQELMRLADQLERLAGILETEVQRRG